MKHVLTTATLAVALLGGTAQAKEYTLQSAFPKGLPVLTDTAEYFVERLAAVTDGQIEFDYLGAGELSPPFEILDNVGAGAIDAGWSFAAYASGQAPAAALFGSIPFGPDAATYFHWLHGGGGLEIWREVYAPFDVVPMPCGMIMSEAGGWFTDPIESPDDLKGLKFRIGGLGGKVLGKLGASAQELPAGEIATSLQTGRLDGTELSFPLVDRLMGFEKVAKHYYFPGWHQPSGIIEFYVNRGVWDGWTEGQRVAVDMACKDASMHAVSFAAAKQQEVLDEFRGAGVEVERFPDSVLEALRSATEEVLDEEAAKDELFAKALDSYRAFAQAYGDYEALNRLPTDE